jgi:outer membrane protein OmpA-like peptidoglycan-associated protein
MWRRGFAAVLTAIAFAVSAAWATKDFRVFFRKNDCAITIEARSVIADFARLVASTNVQGVTVEGNAGRDEGTTAEIVQLSRCRGEGVKTALVAEGIDASRITVIANGDRDPLSVLHSGNLMMDRQATMYGTEWHR